MTPRTLHIVGLMRGVKDPSEAGLGQREVDWVAALGLDMRTVVADQTVLIDDDAVELEVFELDAGGQRRRIAGHTYARHKVSVPLTADPADFGLVTK